MDAEYLKMVIKEFGNPTRSLTEFEKQCYEQAIRATTAYAAYVEAAYAKLLEREFDIKFHA